MSNLNSRVNAMIKIMADVKGVNEISIINSLKRYLREQSLSIKSKEKEDARENRSYRAERMVI